MKNLLKPLALTALGAAAMYYLDPERGRHRRALVGDQLDRVSHQVGDFVQDQSHRAAVRARELAMSARRPLSAAAAPLAAAHHSLDEVVHEAGDFVHHQGRRALRPLRSWAASLRSPAPEVPARLQAYPLLERAHTELDRLMRRPDAVDRARASMLAMSRGSLVGRLVQAAALCAASAAAMYYLDPQMGRHRRAGVRDRFDALSDGTRDYVRTQRDRATEQIRGVAAKARAPFGGRWQSRSDRLLDERIRSQLHRLVSHPEDIELLVSQGNVSLRGPVLASEVDTLLSMVRAVAGAQHIDNRLEVHEAPGRIAALQGSEPPAVTGSRTSTWTGEAPNMLH